MQITQDCFWSYLYLLHALCYRSWLGLCCANVLLGTRLIGAAGKTGVPPHKDTRYRKSSSLGMGYNWNKLPGHRLETLQWFQWSQTVLNGLPSLF